MLGDWPRSRAQKKKRKNPLRRRRQLLSYSSFFSASLIHSLSHSSPFSLTHSFTRSPLAVSVNGRDECGTEPAQFVRCCCCRRSVGNRQLVRARGRERADVVCVVCVRARARVLPSPRGHQSTQCSLGMSFGISVHGPNNTLNPPHRSESSRSHARLRNMAVCVCVCGVVWWGGG